LPVVPKATRAQIVATTILYAPFWKDVKVMSLNVNMRLLAQADHMTEVEHRHATEFAAWQLKLGQGNVNHDGFMIKLPMGMKMVPIFAEI
jgi:PIF1-like helicase